VESEYCPQRLSNSNIFPEGVSISNILAVDAIRGKEKIIKTNEWNDVVDVLSVGGFGLFSLTFFENAKFPKF
jgi:hypothetical protein